MFRALGFGGPAAKFPGPTQSLTALEERHALHQAMKAMDLLMDDAVEDAEKALKSGQSSFHKLSSGIIAFLRASLGFEPEAMKEASDRLADAEASAERDRKRAVKETHHNTRFPPGTEFALCHAEAQLMAAVVGLLSESMGETLRAFYKLRTAYKTLEEIHATISTIDLAHDKATRRAGISESTLPSGNISYSNLESAPNLANQPSDGLNMRDTGKIEGGGMQTDRSVSNQDEIELFTASGSALCFGLLLLILGMVPTSLMYMLRIVGFHGDREQGLSMLWKAAEADNVNGAIAILIILQYYGNILQFCEILTPESEGVGYSKEKCRRVLNRIRKKYPHNALWMLEEARMKAMEGNVDIAVQILSQPVKIEMRQVEALILFEKSLNCKFLHRYEEVAQGFLELTKLNKWSHGLYHYFAATCYLELYRQSKKTRPGEAKTHAERAEELFLKVPTFMGNKRFMAQGIPLEIFADRKIKKWQARATIQGTRLVDAVGVSPIEEMIYIWNGYKRMDHENLEASLKAISFGREKNDDADEVSIRCLLESVVYRRLGRLEKAKSLLEPLVDQPMSQALLCDKWMTPTAHYEMAVCLWMQHGPGEHNDEITQLLTKVSGFSGYELDNRIGLKVQTAMDTMTRYNNQEIS